MAYSLALPVDDWTLRARYRFVLPRVRFAHCCRWTPRQPLRLTVLAVNWLIPRDLTLTRRLNYRRGFGLLRIIPLFCSYNAVCLADDVPYCIQVIPRFAGLLILPVNMPAPYTAPPFNYMINACWQHCVLVHTLTHGSTGYQFCDLLDAYLQPYRWTLPNATNRTAATTYHGSPQHSTV